jgi:hypothetical protein
VCARAETFRKLYTALGKGSEPDLPDLLLDCAPGEDSCAALLDSFKVLTNHTVLSQVWSVELNQLVRNSQMPGLIAQLCHTSGRATAIQAAHEANVATPTADDIATYIMEDLAHKCVAC